MIAAFWKLNSILNVMFFAKSVEENKMKIRAYFHISFWDVTKCSFMSITETYKWFFIIGLYLRVVKMRFSLKGILDIQEARRHLYFSRKTSRKYIFSMSVLNLWVDFTKVLFEEKSVLRMQLNRDSFPISNIASTFWR